MTPRRQFPRHIVEVFQDPGAGPVDVGAVFEDDVDEGDPELGEPAHHLGPGHRQHGGGQRVGHLVFHGLRRLSRILGVDNDLDVGEVGNGVHRQIIRGINGKEGDDDADQHHQEAVMDDVVNEASNHGISWRPTIRISGKWA